MKLLADSELGTLEGLGPLGKVNTSDPIWSFATFTSVMSTGLAVLTVSGGIWFIIQIMAGTFQWLSSGGEKQALQNAQKRIMNAILGLFVVVFSYALIYIIGIIFGIDILSPARSLGIGVFNTGGNVLTPRPGGGAN
jgi:hypothetical protein